MGEQGSPPLGRTPLAGEGGYLMLSTFGLSSPRKNWLLRSVRTTSLSTVNCTSRQNALCSSGVMESLAQSRAPPRRGSVSSTHAPGRARPSPPLPTLAPDGGWAAITGKPSSSPLTGGERVIQCWRAELAVAWASQARRDLSPWLQGA